MLPPVFTIRPIWASTPNKDQWNIMALRHLHMLRPLQQQRRLIMPITCHHTVVGCIISISMPTYMPIISINKLVLNIMACHHRLIIMPAPVILLRHPHTMAHLRGIVRLVHRRLHIVPVVVILHPHPVFRQQVDLRCLLSHPCLRDWVVVHFVLRISIINSNRRRHRHSSNNTTHNNKHHNNSNLDLRILQVKQVVSWNCLYSKNIG